jgi:group I intron endonuclease
MEIILYKALNKANGKCYIGQTNRSLEKRIQEHLTANNTRFHKALETHGIENFEWTILETCTDRQRANQREIELIEEYNSYNMGYNSHLGGRAGGYTTEESIKKRQATRQANGGYKTVSKKQREENVSQRPEVQQKIRESVKKLWEDPEYRANQIAKREQANPEVECPHCTKKGRRSIMYRWHFDCCKFKK